MKVTLILIVVGALETTLKGMEKKTEGIRNQSENRDLLDHGILLIG